MVEILLHRPGDVHLVHEVDAAPQVQAELQRAEAEAAHPVRHARGLREGDGKSLGCASPITSRAFSWSCLPAKRNVRRP